MQPRPLVSILVAAALVASCSDEPEAAPVAPSTSTSEATTTTTIEPPTTTTTVVLPPPVPISWEACGGGLECGTVAVPVDYADPAVGRLDLALVRRPAQDPANRLGALLVNPGGPGASGVRRVARGFTVSDEVADRFDLVGFDPRGVGGSTPITCGATVDAFRAADLAPDSPAERDELEAAARAVADECTATEGDRLRHLGTREVAHDVEVIRRALREPQLSFVGLSYGTLIGLLWAEAYPSSVRAMVLDGVVDPAAASGLASTKQMDAIESTVHAMDAACAADPGCPLAPHGGLLSAYDELARRVESGEAGQPGFGPTQLAYAVFYATYDAALWPRLEAAIAAALDGDLRGVADMAASFTDLVDYEPFAIVTCLDAEHPVGFEAWQDEADLLDGRSPRFGRIVANELLPCAWWPQSRLVPHRVTAKGTPPILVIGSTGDAATPYEHAVAVAQALTSGALLTVDAAGHVALGDSDCATVAATRYLVDLAVPPAGTRC